MGTRKNGSRKSSAAKARKLCVMALAVIIDEYAGFAYDLGYEPREISAYAQAVARLAETARSKKHLTELLFALEAEIAEQRVPLDKRGTELLKLVLRGTLPGAE